MCQTPEAWFWFHAWGKWSATSHPLGYRFNQRVCTRCGYTQIKGTS